MTTMLDASTVRIEVLGEELRRLREASGQTLAQVAERIGFSLSHLSRMETGRRTQSVEDVSALLAIYGIVGEERLDFLGMAKKSGQLGLWQRNDQTYRSRVTTLALLESRATSIVNVETLLIPGLVQTVPYSQAVFRECGLIEDDDEIAMRVAARVRRQAVVRRLDAPPFVAIVGESALRTPLGGRAVLREQLRYLAEVAERPNVTLRVIPTAIGGHPGLNGSFARMRFQDRSAVVFVGCGTSSLFLEGPTDISAYDRMTRELLDMAMSKENSVRLVAELAVNLE